MLYSVTFHLRKTKKMHGAMLVAKEISVRCFMKIDKVGNDLCTGASKNDCDAKCELYLQVYSPCK